MRGGTTQGARAGSRRGFTVIEMLVAMAVLAILVIVIARVFSDTARCWAASNKTTEMNNNGRAVLDFMVRELSSAAANGVLTFKLGSDDGLDTFGQASDELSFVCLAESADYGRSDPDDNRRAAREVQYYVAPMKDDSDADIPGRFRILRAVRLRSSVVQCYENRNWYGSMAGGNAVLAENISAFEVMAWGRGYRARSDYESANQDDELPLWVDLYIELLGEQDAILAAELSDPAEFIATHAQGYMARVYFPNRVGYSIKEPPVATTTP